MSVGLVPQEWRRVFGSAAARAGLAQQGALPHLCARSCSAADANHSQPTCTDTLHCNCPSQIFCPCSHSIKHIKSSWYSPSHHHPTLSQQFVSNIFVCRARRWLWIHQSLTAGGFSLLQHGSMRCCAKHEDGRCAYIQVTATGT